VFRCPFPDPGADTTPWRVELQELTVEDELRPVGSAVYDSPGAADAEVDLAFGDLQIAEVPTIAAGIRPR
jgi:hypothetical protein